MKYPYPRLSPEQEAIASKIVDSAYRVHSSLGPGILESVYEFCFCYELEKHGLSFRRQVPVPVVYDGHSFESSLRLDVLVEELIVCELNAVEIMLPVFEAQLLSYMKVMGKRLGFLINFNVPAIRIGIKRRII